MGSRISHGRRTTLLSLAALASLATGVVAACSLGLDESLIAAAPDAGEKPDGFVDTGPIDAGADAQATPDAGPCAKDEDCVSTNACLKGRCDLARKACAFDVCHAAACSAATCDTAAKTCGAPKTYTLRPSTFKVGAPAACGRCIAAVHPYVFVGTPSGVVAFNMANPTQAPAAVPVTGLGFVPSLMMTSGSRVFFFGPAVGGGPPSRVPVAWLTVPSDPFVTSIAIENTLAGWNRPSGEGLGTLARSDDGAFLYTGAALLPTAVLPAVPSDRFDLTAYLTPPTPGFGLVSASGTRFLFQSVDANGNASFEFVANVGTPQVTDAGIAATPSPDKTVVAGPQYFSQTADGAVLWSYAQLTAPPQTPGVAVRAVRSGFLVGSAAGPADGATVDVEVYPPNVPNGANVTGPNATLDQGTAMIVTAAKESFTAQTSVQFLKRQPLALVPNADNTPRRAVLPIALGTVVGAAGSNGIGYLLANEAATPELQANASVYVFDPACGP